MIGRPAGFVIDWYERRRRRQLERVWRDPAATQEAALRRRATPSSGWLTASVGFAR